MRVLSFDLGIKNLALCDINADLTTFTVNDWTVKTCLDKDLNVNLTPITEIAPIFYKYIRSVSNAWLFEDGKPNDVEMVLIEAQPMGGRGAARNLKTKVLSHLLQCVVSDLRPELPVHFIHPGLKLKDMVRTEVKSTYRENKAYAVGRTLELITSEECRNTAESKAFFDIKGKKDDLADAFLQGLIACRMHLSGNVIGEPMVPKKTKTKVDKVDKSESKTETKRPSKKTKVEAEPGAMQEPGVEPGAEPEVKKAKTKKAKPEAKPVPEAKPEAKPEPEAKQAKPKKSETKKRKITDIVSDEADIINV